MAVISFLVSSGLTINDACSIGPYFTVYTNVTDEATQCAGCYTAGQTCWACLNADDPAQTLYLDAALTLPVYPGPSYLVNEVSPGIYNYWTVETSFPRGGPGFFGSCPFPPTPTPTANETPTQTPTPDVTPTPTITNTATPNIPTPTPTPSETPKQINFKTIANDFQRLTAAHKQLNSFGLGDINQLSYWTQFRDNVENTEYQSPYYPLLYVVPSTIENQLQYKTWNFNIMIADILERDLDNQVDISSDTLQILQDVISQFRLSVSEIQGDYYDKYYINDNVECVPFLEKMDDLLNGWSGLLKIKTMTTLNRCTAAYNVFTGTPIVHDTINFKTFHDDFRLLADHHKQLNSFGFGSKQDFTYWTESRDKQDNPHYQSPYYPLLYVIPDNVFQEFGDMRYTFNVIVADIIERNLDNQTDVLSDTNQILDDIIGQFRLSVNDALGNFNEKYYLNNPVVCRPFLEKYDDLLGGWVAKMDILVPNALDRCNAAFRPFNTPTPTKTPTQTPTTTSTPTPSITVSQTSTITPTLTQTPTETSTQTPTPSITPSETPTNTPSETPTNTPTLTPSITSSQTPTVTETPTNTPTITASNTPTLTSTPTLTATVTSTPTLTPSPTPCICFPPGSGFTQSGGFTFDILSIQLDQTLNRMYVGGDMIQYNGTSIANFTALDLTSGNIVGSPFNTNTLVNGTVLNIFVQSDSKVLLGGSFTQYSGVSQNRLTRINPNGSRDIGFTIGTGFNNSISSILVDSNNKILVGGVFTTYSGTNIGAFIRLNSDGSIDNTFSGLTTGFSGSPTIRQIVEYNNQYYVGGTWSTYNGSSVPDIIRLNQDGSLDTTFSAVTYSGTNEIRGIGIQSSGKPVVADINGTTQRLNTNGSVDTSFTATSYAAGVSVLKVLSNDQILVGGRITGAGIKRINQNGGNDSTFNTTMTFINQTGRGVQDIQVTDGCYFIGGDWTELNGQIGTDLARIYSNGTLDICNPIPVSPTPTNTATRTPTPSITATQTGTPANTPTPTSTGVSTQLWNTNSNLWNNENQQWNLI